ncbi:MAG: recombinase family protein [Lachnospiraceae bacterium]|nr:recombinase family protein [Lachnospiraceae bacterium]
MDYQNNRSTLNSSSGAASYRVASYLRLSREDGDKAESDSIANQRTLIAEFLKGKTDMVITEEFADDGYSGTSFDRPAFQRMIEAAKAHRINCIVVKDLSRLGRNYIESGRYLEKVFPMMGVRFIAILDNYDSAKDDESGQLLLAFKNIFNDGYCRDISMKIRSQLDVKRRNGQFIGSFAAYGYKKDPENKNRLLVDEYPAEIVQHIFKLKLNGFNARRIAEKLNELGALTPLEYKRSCGQNFNGGFRSGKSPKWSATSVLRILSNEIYTGTMVQNKMKKINYKIKECREVPPTDWIRVEGTHEAIIPRAIYDAVQEAGRLDTRTPPMQNKIYPFSGIIKCGGCGENLIRRNAYRRADGEMVHWYTCSTYKYTKGCSPHSIPERIIGPIVLKAVQEQTSVLLEAEGVLEEISRLSACRSSVHIYDNQIGEAEAEERRYLDLKTRLYQDMRDGIVSCEEYVDMSGRFSEKAEAARAKKKRLEEIRQTALTRCSDEPQWLSNFKAARDVIELDRNTVITLINKVIVHDKENIEVVFRYADEMANYVALTQESVGNTGNTEAEAAV